MMQLEVERVVVPIFAIDNPSGGPLPLGTGFFVRHGSGSVLITCNHVVEEAPGQLAIAILPDSNQLHVANVISGHPNVDLAVLEVPTYEPPHQGLTLGLTETHGNLLVVCHEHSQSRREGTRTILSASARVGNITRSLKSFDLKLLGQKHGGQVEALELSFPALRGASGAPVMSNDGYWRVLGIVVANVSKELAPSRIETVFDEDGQVEEQTRIYNMPQGIAVRVDHLKAILSNEVTR